MSGKDIIMLRKKELNKKQYQIEEVMAGKVVNITKGINSAKSIFYHDRSVKFKKVDDRPEQLKKQKLDIRRRAAYIPPADHPWRKFKIGRNASQTTTEVAV